MLTEYLKHKLRSQRAKRLGRSLPTQVEPSVQLERNTDRLHNWPRTLSTVKEVRSVLGVLGYQRPFIPHYADIARPLTALTKKNTPFVWTTECHTALDTLISAVTEGPMLAQPDMNRPFFLQVDASAYATGAILSQQDERGKH